MKSWKTPKNKRDKILDATLEAIGNGGIDAITHRSVAEIAGVATGSVGYHFETKQILLREAFRYYVREISETIMLTNEVARPFTEKAFIAAINTISARDDDRPEIIRAEYELLLHAGRDPVLSLEVADWHATLEGRIAVALEALNIEKPIRAARLVRDVIRGVELDRLTNPKQSKSRLEAQLKICLAGFRSKVTVT